MILKKFTYVLWFWLRKGKWDDFILKEVHLLRPATATADILGARTGHLTSHWRVSRILQILAKDDTQYFTWRSRMDQSSLHSSLYLAFKGEYNLSPWKLVLPSNILQVIFFAFYEFSNYPYNCPIASACKSGNSETGPRLVPPLQCNHDLAAWRWRRH